ncbi:MAG: hypothetical protein ACFFB0_01900 [Promethearchaeota archaeon]
MNDLILLCLIMFMCVRAIGLGVSIDFFYDSKDHKFLYFILCWCFWIVANIFPIIVDLTEINILMEFYLVLNILFAVLGFVFYIWGFFKYYLKVPFRFMVFLTIITITIPLLLYIIIDYISAILFSMFLLNILLLGGYIIPLVKKKDFIKYMGKSLRWYFAIILTFIIYFPVSAISISLGYSYGLYNAENTLIIILYYVPTISSTFLLIILLVHLEYTISSREKFGLKDKYSHNLGNIMQVIYSASDIVKRTTKIENEEEEKLDLIERKCKEASKLIKEIRKL